MRKEFYHILNRGVEKRKIFLTEKDYLRFIHNLYDFNDIHNALSYYHRRQHITDVRHPYTDVARPLQLANKKEGGRKKQRQELVDTLCWVLMNNHPHILAQEKIDGGASKYSQKVFGGYTKYFNEVNDRNGVLFQGGSKIILIERDVHFRYLPYYILSNPVKLIEPDWREKGIKNLKKVIEFLKNYKYSSFPDLIGKNNFPETANKKLFYEMYNTNEKKFKNDFIEWLKGFKGDFGKFDDF